MQRDLPRQLVRFVIWSHPWCAVRRRIGAADRHHARAAARAGEYRVAATVEPAHKPLIGVTAAETRHCSGFAPVSSVGLSAFGRRKPVGALGFQCRFQHVTGHRCQEAVSQPRFGLADVGDRVPDRHQHRLPR